MCRVTCVIPMTQNPCLRLGHSISFGAKNVACATNPRIDSRRIKQVYSKAYFEQKPITGLGVYSILRRISRYLAKYMQSDNL